MFRDLKSNGETVNKWLPLEKRKILKGMFVSHSHYDHILDIGEAHKGTQSKVFGSYSTGVIAKASGVPKKFFKKIALKEKIKIGDFEIQIFPGDHPPHLFGMTLASGKVSSDFTYPNSAAAYKMDEVFSFLVQHGEKRIFFNASTVPVKEAAGAEFDLIVQGLAHKDMYQPLYEGQFKSVMPKAIMGSHFDDFFIPLKGKQEELATSSLKAFKSILSDKIKFTTPKLGRTYRLSDLVGAKQAD